jgi:methionyl-tRNA formyltransferase
VCAIVTRPDRVKGRNARPTPPPVKDLALTLCPDIPLFQPEKASAPESAGQLAAFKADLFVVVAYGEIIKDNLLSLPKKGCVNIHASLLPYFRGAAPMQRALMAGERQTGISLIQMTREMDAGDILAIESIPVPEEMTLGELEIQLQALASKLLLHLLDALTRGPVVRTPQNHALATFAPKLTALEEKIDWNRPAQEIHNQIRALSPFPGAWCHVKIGSEIKRLKIKRSTPLTYPGTAAAALISFGKEGWIVGCGQNALRLLEVQLEGKKAMTVEEFLRGVSTPLLMLCDSV